MFLVGADYAYATQDAVNTESRVSTITDAAGVPAAQVSKIAALLATAEHQITTGRIWAPPADNASDTLLAIIAILPGVSVADLKTIQGIPARFTKLAGAAIKAGQYEQARAFLWWAEVFVTN